MKGQGVFVQRQMLGGGPAPQIRVAFGQVHHVL